MKTTVFATLMLSIIVAPTFAAGSPEKRWDQVIPSADSTRYSTTNSFSVGPTMSKTVEPIFSPNR